MVGDEEGWWLGTRERTRRKRNELKMRIEDKVLTCRKMEEKDV